MTAVFKFSASKGAARLVLLALADEANDDGLVTAYRRSHNHLASKANIDPSSVARVTKALTELGELEVLRVGDGRASTDYRVVLPGLIEGPQDKYPQPAGSVPRGLSVSTQGTQAEAPIIPLSPGTTHKETARARPSPFPDRFLLTEAMREWARKEAPTVDLIFETKQFADYWRGKGQEKRTDWVATWRTWIRRSLSKYPKATTATAVQANGWNGVGASAQMSEAEHAAFMDELEAAKG